MLPDAVVDFLKALKDDDARELWTWLADNEQSASQQIVDIIADSHQHIFEGGR